MLQFWLGCGARPGSPIGRGRRLKIVPVWVRTPAGVPIFRVAPFRDLGRSLGAKTRNSVATRGVSCDNRRELRHKRRTCSPKSTPTLARVESQSLRFSAHLRWDEGTQHSSDHSLPAAAPDSTEHEAPMNVFVTPDTTVRAVRRRFDGAMEWARDGVRQIVLWPADFVRSGGRRGRSGRARRSTWLPTARG